jgi:hypothetical protein
MVKRPAVFALILACAMGCRSTEGADRSPEEIAPAGVLRVHGSRLYDADGREFVIRGIEDFLGDRIEEIAKTGANACRFVNCVTAENLDELLYKAIAENGMVVSVMLNDSAAWNTPEVKMTAKNYESHLIIHAMGEAQFDGYADGADERWVKEAKQTIARFRSYGYTCPLDIMADSWGQNLSVLLRRGREVIESDPEKNVILGCQVYTPDGTLKGLGGVGIEEAIQAVARSGLPIQLGSCPFTGEDCRPLYGAWPDGWLRVWKGAHEYGIGCLYWCWTGSPSWFPACDGLTTDGVFGHWSKYGEEICGSGASAMSAVSAKYACAMENRPPRAIGRIMDIVVGTGVREIEDHANLKAIFTDHEDGTGLEYSITVAKPAVLSARIDAEGNIDIAISPTGYGTSGVEVAARDSGGKQAVRRFTARVYDPARKNLALRKQVTVSSVESKDTPGACLSDGRENTRWASAWADDQWAVVDLGAEFVIDCIGLKWEAAYGRRYEIQVSPDGQSWKTIYVEENGDGEVDEFALEPVPARYVKMRGIARATDWGYSLWELAVYQRR